MGADVAHVHANSHGRGLDEIGRKLGVFTLHENVYSFFHFACF
jgi:hypothetical protein